MRIDKMWQQAAGERFINLLKENWQLIGKEALNFQ